VRGIPFCGLLALLLTSGKALGQERARVDALGDPLPSGAVARLGSMRFRPGGRVWHLVYSPGGSQLAAWSESGLSIWDAATGRELRRVELPNLTLHAISWASDDQALAIVDIEYGNPVLWNFVDEKAKPPERPGGAGFQAVRADEERFNFFAISPGGKCLAAGRGAFQDGERHIDLLAAEAGKRVRELTRQRQFGPHPGNCRGLLFTPDGKWLIALSEVRSAKEEWLSVWDVATGKEHKRFRLEPGEISRVFVVSPDNRTLALGREDGTTRLFDLDTGKEKRSWPKRLGEGSTQQGVTAVAFGPGGKTLLTAGRESVTRVWGLETGKQLRTLGNDFSWVQAIVLSPDGKHITTAGQGGLIRVIDAESGADVVSTYGHRAWVHDLAVAPDGRSAATVSWDRTLRVWELPGGRGRRRIDLDEWPSGRVYFTPDSKVILVGFQNGSRMWDADTGQPLPLPGPLAGYAGQPLHVAADRRTLLTSYRGEVTLWDWPAGRPRQKVTLVDDKIDPKEMVCSAASLSPDGRFLLTSSQRHWEVRRGNSKQSSASFVAVELWDAKTGRLVQRLNSAPVNYPTPLFTPGGRSFLFAGSAWENPANALGVWNLRTLKHWGEFAATRPAAKGSYRSLRSPVLSPDGRTLAVAEDREQCVTLYETLTGGIRRRLTGHRGDVMALAFTTDGKHLVTAGMDAVGLVWDVSLAGAAERAEAPTAAELEQYWAELAGSKTEPAYRALARLAAHPQAGVAFVKERLRAATGPDEAALNRIVAALADKQFAVRERAAAELDRLGDAALPGILARLESAKDLELRRRLEVYLDKHDRAVPSGERLREQRALELLEQIGTAEARALLRALVQGTPTVRLTQDAAAALRRLERRDS
jgi:WD40 repeat protein